MKRQNRVLLTRLITVFFGLCAFTGIGAAQQTVDFGDVVVGSALAPFLLTTMIIIGNRTLEVI